MCWIQGVDQVSWRWADVCWWVQIWRVTMTQCLPLCVSNLKMFPNMVTPNCIITGEECRGMHSFYPATDKLPLLSNPQEWIALWCNIVYASLDHPCPLGIPTHDPSVCPMRWLTSCYYTRCQTTLPPDYLHHHLNVVFQVFLKHYHQL